MLPACYSALAPQKTSAPTHGKLSRTWSINPWMGDHPETPRPEVGKDSSRLPAASRVGASPALSLSKSRAGRREASRRMASPTLPVRRGGGHYNSQDPWRSSPTPATPLPPAPLSPRSCTWRRRGHRRLARPLAIGASGARPESQYAPGRAEPHGARKPLRGKGAPRLPDPSVPTGSAPEPLPAGAEQGAGGGGGGGKPGLQVRRGRRCSRSPPRPLQTGRIFSCTGRARCGLLPGRLSPCSAPGRRCLLPPPLRGPRGALRVGRRGAGLGRHRVCVSVRGQQRKGWSRPPGKRGCPESRQKADKGREGGKFREGGGNSPSPAGWGGGQRYSLTWADLSLLSEA